jgi:hypothetical protein
MKTLKFECELLSDVIINSKSATEGNRETLDFIPGNNFLGIAARELYKETNEESWTLFHSGKVRFGDAHPSTVHTATRSLRVPADYFHPKLTGETEGKVYVQNLIPEDILNSEELKDLQLKQCRSGFYAFDGQTGWPVNPQKNFAIKSAYDRDKRRSADEEMFGYEALCKGTTFLFEVETDDDGLAGELTQALRGIQRLGRSHTAQYGEVKITPVDFPEIPSQVSLDDEYMVYADGRLIFLDENNEPTFKPTASQLGFNEGAKVYWDKSQIRTFQYAPWNGIRHCYDMDRCGIEKGSVIVVHGSLTHVESSYVGAYNNEGFGKVIYNPSFLAADENGQARVVLQKDQEDLEQTVLPMRIEGANTPLLKYVDRQIHRQEICNQVYQDVNDFVEDKENCKLFSNTAFASQWGAIRDIAMEHHSKQSLEEELFTKTMEKTRRGAPKKGQEKVHIGYLTHGVAAEKWSKRGRLRKFKVFFDKLTDENAQLALINLASEMAKIYRKQQGKENRNDHR